MEARGLQSQCQDSWTCGEPLKVIPVYRDVKSPVSRNTEPCSQLGDIKPSISLPLQKAAKSGSVGRVDNRSGLVSISPSYILRATLRDTSLTHHALLQLIPPIPSTPAFHHTGSIRQRTENRVPMMTLRTQAVILRDQHALSTATFASTSRWRDIRPPRPEVVTAVIHQQLAAAGRAVSSD